MAQKKKFQKKNYQKNNQMRKIAKEEAKKVVKREIEVKEHDEMNNTTISTTINNTDPIQTLVRGTDANDFIGDKINPTGLSIRMVGLAGDSHNIVRLLVIQDKDIVGSPTLGTMFENTTYPAVSSLNTNYTHQYNVLYDKTIALSTNGGGGAFPFVKRIYIKGKRLRQIRFDSAGDCNAGQIWIVGVSDSNALAHPSFQIYTRLYFTDA